MKNAKDYLEKKTTAGYRKYVMSAMIFLSIGLFISCYNADNTKTTIETNQVEIDSSINTSQDTIRFPDTMASGVSF